MKSHQEISLEGIFKLTSFPEPTGINLTEKKVGKVCLEDIGYPPQTGLCFGI